MNQENGSSPAGRGGAGFYIEGELGAFYLLAMLSQGEPFGLPGSRIQKVRFQASSEGFPLDDLVIEATCAGETSLLEIQSKRTITFAPGDAIFKDVCSQIAAVVPHDGVAPERHYLGVATQRTSARISGPYQEVLAWARSTASPDAFFGRLAAKGVASPPMRDFVQSFRANLVAAGGKGDDHTIWLLLRRFMILEMDFEAHPSMTKLHAFHIAQTILSEDGGNASSLWSNLVELSSATATTGGSLDRAGLIAGLLTRGFRFSGDRNLAPARMKLAELTRHALANIGTSVANVHLPRTAALSAVDSARDEARIIEIRGGPGVGKSGVLRVAAEREIQRSHVIFLDPVSTPSGGWMTFAQLIGLQQTARELFTDMASGGTATVFIDSLEMFTDPGQQRTINDLLREIGALQGFTVVISAREEFGADGSSWLAQDVIERFGEPARISLDEVDDDEVAYLAAQAPELRVLLAEGHPAAPIARNLYRLSRLLRVSEPALIRTEASLAEHWWRSADGATPRDQRPSQRLLSDLADAVLAGVDVIPIREDSAARTHLLGSRSLKEPKRDQVAFYHDILADWAVGMRLHEDIDRFAGGDMTRPVSPRVARGIEFAGRLALERSAEDGAWLSILSTISTPGSHPSWRRQVLLAIVRSELVSALLERHSETILAHDGSLLIELIGAIHATETVRLADLIPPESGDTAPPAITVPKSFRTTFSPGARSLLRWAIKHSSEIPGDAIASVLKLIEIQMPMLLGVPELARPSAEMVFDWLMMLDSPDVKSTIRFRSDSLIPDRSARNRLVEELRTLALLLAAQAKDRTKQYLASITAERNQYKIKFIRQFAQTLAPVAPDELADMIETSLIDPPARRSSGYVSRDRALSHSDTDYMPPSPAQPPFLAILEASPSRGLALIRRLTAYSLDVYSKGADPGDDGLTLQFGDGPRFFPWLRTYYWSRDQAQDYSVASGLMALEAWGHQRLDAGEAIDNVLGDILGPDGSCAAYVLVAVDLLLSHWPATRDATAPFISSPELLAIERGRQIHDSMNVDRFSLQSEPAGKVRLADLQKRASRGAALERALPYYITNDESSLRVQASLAAAVKRLGPFEEKDDFGTPEFMGAYALNLVDRDNWVEVGGQLAYRSPPSEAQHLSRLEEHRLSLFGTSEIEAKISLATSNKDHASSEVARAAANYAGEELPDASEADALRSRATRIVQTALLIARDGDDNLLGEREEWVRRVIDTTLNETGDRYSGGSDIIDYNRPALATSALVHLWLRRGLPADRDRLVSIAVRSDRCGPLAFSRSLNQILDKDARLIKSVVRAGLLSCRWYWHPRDDEQEKHEEEYGSAKTLRDSEGVAAETGWLSGGDQPSWAPFPVEASSDEGDCSASSRRRRPHRAVEQANSQAAAHWLDLVAGRNDPRLDWTATIVETYSEWSAIENGYGSAAERSGNLPTEWNNQFYILVADVMMNGSRDDFEREMSLVEGLSDRAFADVTETLLHACDALFFNNSSQSPDRSNELRRRIGARMAIMGRWQDELESGRTSIEMDLGSLVAKFFFNTHNPFTGTRTYLVPKVFDRVDLLLDELRPYAAGGPTTFVAICTMNVLEVSPHPRHAEFLIAAVESWFRRLPRDSVLWSALGIGKRVVSWLGAAADQDPLLLARCHELRSRIDAVIGRLVQLGIAEAYDLERRIEHAQSGDGVQSSNLP